MACNKCCKCLKKGLPWWVGAGTIAAIGGWLTGAVSIAGFVVAGGWAVLVAAVGAFILFFAVTLINCKRSGQC